MLIDLKPALCPSGDECLYRDGDKLLYADSNHLTEDGALYAARGLRLPAMDATSLAADAQRAAGAASKSDERQAGDP